MITIKLPYNTSSENENSIKDIQRIQSSMIRFIFNRLHEKMPRKNIAILCKEKFNLDSWFIQSSYIKAKSLFDSNDKKKIFGGKFNFNQRKNGKISKEEFKEKRLLPIHIEGESPKNGNRKFNLDIVKHNKIIFKPKHGLKIEIILPKLRKSYLKHLTLLERLAKQKSLPYTIEMSKDFIYISFEMSEIKRLRSVISRAFTKNDVRIKSKESLKALESKNINKSNKNRILGIDLNPNYLGYSIIEFKNNNFKIIRKEYIDFTKLNHNSKDKKYNANKKKHELIESLKFMFKIAVQYNISKISIEELNFKNKGDKGLGKRFNRLTLNTWHRNLILQQLEKRCVEHNIELIKINPAYSSIVGNVLYGSNTTPDSIAASIEIARRGFNKYKKNWFYPDIPTKEFLQNRWKEDVNIFGNTWKELYSQIKESKLRYRFLHDKQHAFAVLKMFSNKSWLERVSYI